MNSMEKQIYNRIIVNPEIMVGKPIIKGTRIPVDLIIELFAQGLTKKEILEDYPMLQEDDILAVLRYVAELAKGESIYTINLKDE